MTIYVVTNKATGQEVYRYSNDAPVEWVGMEYATHDHTALPDVVEPGAASVFVWTPYEFVNRFNVPEHAAIMASKDPYVMVFLHRLNIATAEGRSIHSNEENLRAGIAYLRDYAANPMVDGAKILTAQRHDEILGGA